MCFRILTAPSVFGRQLRRPANSCSCTLQQDNRLPLLSTDLDDTFLPFSGMLGDKELQVLTAYLETGAHIAFNTLAPKEWFYLRVMERMASAFHRGHRARLFSRVHWIHWIVSGGEEIFVYEHSHHSYRRIYFAPQGIKGEGVLHLMKHLGDSIAFLALYGDRFDDPGNDGKQLETKRFPWCSMSVRTKTFSNLQRNRFL